jgi:hypothetical protein
VIAVCAEKHTIPKDPKQQFMEILDDLCRTIPAVAERREMLVQILPMIDKVEAGGVMDAIIRSRSYLNSITDCGSDAIALVYNSGWSIGFEGDGGELVILISAIESIKPRKTGLEINLESGETIYLRFHCRVRG